MELWWAFLLLGAAVGFFAGLLGVGGGGIMVPVLTSLFLSLGFAESVHMALATSLAAIITTSFASARSHNARQAVLWPVVWRMSPGIIGGTLLAALVAALIPTTALAWFFSIFMAYVAVQMLWNIKPKPSRSLPGALPLAATGFGIGAISALVAIGGGSLTVPFLTWCNVKVQQAIGTSAALGLPIAISGTLGYAISGVLTTPVEMMPDWSVGYLYLPAVLFISAVSFFTAPLGVRLAHRLPVPTLKKLFALLLLGLSAKMLHHVVYS
ncbi:MAG: sulfite exporter TauE/SafE family protein [Gammaproteobacteria bacterium]|nr:sulfite exporter TauE/SafE family protein [Gammaproteobacteria bacterium]MBU2225041.1 sulfite exporter TauE/SafE family protein [Gammaproteobacteria bacterium]